MREKHTQRMNKIERKQIKHYEKRDDITKVVGKIFYIYGNII